MTRKKRKEENSVFTGFEFGGNSLDSENKSKKKKVKGLFDLL